MVESPGFFAVVAGVFFFFLLYPMLSLPTEISCISSSVQTPSIVVEYVRGAAPGVLSTPGLLAEPAKFEVE